MTKYWYMTYIDECPVCGRGNTERKRMYTPKPENPADRYEYCVNYDYCDVW